MLCLSRGVLAKLKQVQKSANECPLHNFLYPSGGTKFMLLESFTKHPSRSTADHIFKPVLCGRCGTVNKKSSFKHMGAVRKSRSQIYELMRLLCFARLLKPASR